MFNYKNRLLACFQTRPAVLTSSVSGLAQFISEENS